MIMDDNKQQAQKLSESFLKDFVQRLNGEKQKDAPLNGDVWANAGLAKRAAEHTSNQTVYNYLKQNYPVSTLKWVKDAEWSRKKVPLEKIKMARRPGGARETDKVKGIAGAVKEGKPMEPIVLVKLPNGDMKIADGFHRTLGFKHAERKTIDAYVGKVEEDKGSWDKEMHEKKKNIGKAAEEDEQMSLAKLAGIGSMAGGAVKSFGKMFKDTADDLTGKTVYKAQNKKTQAEINNLQMPTRSSKNEIKSANKGLKKAKARQNTTRAAGLGLAGVAGYDQYKKKKENQTSETL